MRLASDRIPRSWFWWGVTAYSTLSLALFSFLWYQTDTPSFVNAIHLMAGEVALPDRLFRLTKPLALLFPTLLYQGLGLPPSWGLLLQQYLAYWLGAWALYRWLQLVLSSDRLAFYGLLAYLGMQPLAVYGLAMLTDGLGWCVLLWGLYWGQRVLWGECNFSLWSRARCWLGCWREPLGSPLLGVYFGLGCLVKESVLVAGLWAAGLVLARVDWTWRQKLRVFLRLGIGFMGVLLLASGLTAWIWDSSLWTWIQFGRSAPPPFTWKGFLAQAYHSLDGFWWLLPLGGWVLWRNPKHSLLWVSLATAGLGWLLLPLVWPYTYDRILFMLVPLLLPLLAQGVQLLGRWAIPLLLLGGVGHLLITYFIYRHQIQGLIVPFGLVYGSLLGLATWQQGIWRQA